MTYGVFQNLKERFWSSGAKITMSEQAPALLSACEIESMKQQLKENSDVAREIRATRSRGANPRILAARKAGANI